MKRLAIFAVYDKDNIIDDYVLFYLKELSKLSDIIYIADYEMPETELNKIKYYTIKAISERHGEYDFGSYKRGYIYAKENNILENYDYLILCNDSVYGPFFSLEELFNKMKDYKFGGLYKSKDIKIANHYYIGSFFIVIKKEIFSSDIFSNFIISVYIGNDTNYVYMGATSADGQLWIMPVKKDGKDYLIRLLEHGGPEMYKVRELKSDMEKYRTNYMNSLAKALALSSTNANIEEIKNACYLAIYNDANYKANKYFFDVVSDMGAKGGENGIYVSSSKPITHYVIEIVDIE